MATTELSDFLALASNYNVIPLHATLQLDRETPVSLYQRFANSRSIFLLESAALGKDTGRYSFIGLDRKWRVTTLNGKTVVTGADVANAAERGPLEVLRELMSRYKTYIPTELPSFFGGAVGFVTYDYVRRLERLPRQDVDGMWPDIDFSFPGAVLICDHLSHSTTVVVNALIEDGADPKDAFNLATAQLQEIIEVLVGPSPANDPATERLVATAPSARAAIDIKTLAASFSNFTKEQYCSVVERAKKYIFAGDVFQVVPSQQFNRPTSVDPLTLYRVLRSLNPSPYMYLLDTGESQIVGASPEMLVRVHEGQVITHPIAGTRPRGANEKQDVEIEKEMLNDEKEISEHVMLVDLGRNDIGRVSAPGTVKVDRLAQVERFSHLMHLVSQVSGQLADGKDAFDAFNATFPAGTLTGAPKVRAMELIDEFEPVHRGPYGGALGYFSLTGEADFAITIRTLSIRNGIATVQAGGGVVADSVPELEYQECINKASAPLLALEITDPSK